MNQPSLHTDRLILRPLHPDDAEDLFPMYSDLETMRFDPELPHPSVDFTREFLTRELSYPGNCYWSILKLGTQKPIGLIGYIGGSAIPGIGYMLRRDQWGQGLATEACRAALDYGFTELGYAQIEFWIEPHNPRSVRVVEKLDAKPRSSITIQYRHRPNPHLMIVYGITADEWHGTTPFEAHVSFLRCQPVLLVHNVMESVNYYRNQLGFGVEFLYRETPESEPTHAGVARGHWTGSRVVIQLSEAPQGRSIEPAGYLYVFVDAHIDALYEQYREQGVEIVAPPQNYPWGLREFTIRDPDGHKLRFGTQS